MKQNAKQLSFDESIIDPSKLRTTVRFSQEEYKAIKEDSNTFNRSVAELLRARYFSHLPTTILMNAENFKQFQRTYSGIANNCNQLAKKAHLGFSIPEKAVRELLESNNKLFTLVSSLNGYGKNKI